MLERVSGEIFGQGRIDVVDELLAPHFVDHDPLPGLPPDREFGSHVHALPCGQNAAGGHYRNDPAGPATADNEIWLDFATTSAGTGNSQAVAAFLLRPNGAHAVVIHDHETDPVTGAAGPKLACVDVNFDE